jgi:hypothetical protein
MTRAIVPDAIAVAARNAAPAPFDERGPAGMRRSPASGSTSTEAFAR